MRLCRRLKYNPSSVYRYDESTILNHTIQWKNAANVESDRLTDDDDDALVVLRLVEQSQHPPTSITFRSRMW
jgi:hypothetical protein